MKERGRYRERAGPREGGGEKGREGRERVRGGKRGTDCLHTDIISIGCLFLLSINSEFSKSIFS